MAAHSGDRLHPGELETGGKSIAGPLSPVPGRCSVCSCISILHFLLPQTYRCFGENLNDTPWKNNRKNLSNFQRLVAEIGERQLTRPIAPGHRTPQHEVCSHLYPAQCDTGPKFRQRSHTNPDHETPAAAHHNSEMRSRSIRPTQHQMALSR